MPTRRAFLHHAGLLAVARAVPEFVVRTARAAQDKHDGRILVVLQLDGGNDGINTVVPFTDGGYARHRKALRLDRDRLVTLNDSLGLHTSLAPLGKRFEAGQLAIVQGVSYPNPNRSHFRSMAIWHTARLDAEEQVGLGWLGRALDGTAGTAVHIGAGPPPVALRGRRAVASTIERLEDFALPAGPAFARSLPADEAGDELLRFVRRSSVDAHAAARRLAALAKGRGAGVSYPNTALGRRLQLIAQLMKTGLGARVYYTLQTGYDTHADQLGPHAVLLFELGGAIHAFLEDLKAARLDERVVLLAFSEFGRTVKENGSGGTDHGTAGPVFLIGKPVQGGLVGTTPSLTDLDAKHGDLKGSLDFRRVYATVLTDWLGLPARAAVGDGFSRLPLLRG